MLLFSVPADDDAHGRLIFHRDSRGLFRPGKGFGNRLGLPLTCEVRPTRRFGSNPTVVTRDVPSAEW